MDKIQINNIESLKQFLIKAAHDINNALSVIQLETEILKNEMLVRKISQINEITRSMQLIARSG